MKFSIREIKNGVATVDFDDGAWAEVPMNSGDTVETFASNVAGYATKTFVAPDWAVPEAPLDAAKVERVLPEIGVGVPVLEKSNPEWLTNRISAYGSMESQIEFITENGLEAWQKEVADIKLANPIV